MKDLHIEPFSDETLTKLEIFQSYAKSWLPVFTMQDWCKEIHIIDFFAGPGFDVNNVKGSPIIFLDIIFEQQNNLLNKKKKIILHLNEYEPNKKNQYKFETLKSNCQDYISKFEKSKFILEIKYYNEDFSILFDKFKYLFGKHPILLYLDQNGVKFIKKSYLQELEKHKYLDFFYFVSSSSFSRFKETNELKSIFGESLNQLKLSNYFDIHREVLQLMRSFLSLNSDLDLFPFTIKKGTNIYGIIFGAKHFLAFDKFLKIAWDQNSINGEANFDIDLDKTKGQLPLFGALPMTKIEKFQKDFEDLIIKGEINTNKEALLYIYSCGHIPQHGVDVLKKIKSENKINYNNSSPLLNYEQVFKNKKILEYSLIK